MMHHWLIQEDIGRTLAEYRRTRAITSEDRRAHAAFVAEQGVPMAGRGGRDRGPRSLHVSGEIAEIRVEGVLTPTPDIWSWFFGIPNTTYADLQEAFSLAQSDESVKSVRLVVDSPGGTVDGFFDTIAAIESLRAVKPMSVLATNAQSAAYGIAAAAGPIEAQNAAASFGSVGVAVSYWVRDDVVDLTNTESPDKRPDVATEQGRAVVVKYLDALHGLFVEAIATGRGTTSADVTENFGRGATFIARDAQRRGLINSIAKPAQNGGTSASSSPEAHVTDTTAEGGNAGAETDTMPEMTLQTLRADHTAAYEAAVEAGVKLERDRVGAHLTLGVASGDTKTAHAAIFEGTEMTETLRAKYMAASMNRADQSNRQADSDAAGAVVEGAEPTATSGDPEAEAEQEVLATMLKNRGLES